MQLAVAIKDKLGQITSSPCLIPATHRASCNAVVQEETAMACSHPTYAANLSSNSATRGPCVTQPERSTSSTPISSSSPMKGRATGIIAFVTLRTELISHLLQLLPFLL